MVELEMSGGGQFHGKIPDESDLQKIVEKLLYELWETGRLSQASIKIPVFGILFNPIQPEESEFRIRY
jgi:hypothetical protein